jgi:arsenate reductase
MTPTNILFLCPHAAAKSVLAMTYFEDLAARSGLNVTVANAGTEPDPAINPKVANYLKNEGFDLSGFVPSLLRDEHLETADIVVSMGCISADRVPVGTRFLDWADVPMLSDDFQIARDCIYDHVVELMAELNG